MEFYEEFNQWSRGINFPFWSAHPETKWSPFDLDYRNAIFVGNLHGKVRKGRAEIISKLPIEIDVYGKIELSDREKLRWWGSVDSPQELSKIIVKSKFALNIPQFFENYKGTDFDFPQLRKLGGFQTPSRIVQYAAHGVPSITLGFPGIEDGGLRGQIIAKDIEDLHSILKNLTISELKLVGSVMHKDYLENFTPERRAEFIEYLSMNDEWHSADAETRSRMYRDFPGVSLPTRHGASLGKFRSNASALVSISKGLISKWSKHAVLFGEGWLSDSTEIRVLEDELLEKGISVHRLNPYLNSSMLLPDPLGDFKGLLSEVALPHSLLKRVNYFVISGSDYSLCPALWKKLRECGIKIVFANFDSSIKSRKYSRGAGRADAVSLMRRPDLSYANTLGMNHIYAAKFSQRSSRKEVEIQDGPLEVKTIRPFGKHEGNILRGESLATSVYFLTLEYVDYPIRARRICREMIGARVTLILPRAVLDLLGLIPDQAVYGYDCEEEGEVLVRHVVRTATRTSGDLVSFSHLECKRTLEECYFISRL